VPWNRTLAAGVALVPFLAITGTNAAELPVKAPPLVAAASWTGFYMGASAGGGFSQKTFIDNYTPFGDVGGIDATPHPTGWVGGLQAGYNYQINSLLVGAEADFTWSGARSTFSCFPLLAPQTCTADPEWIGAFAGRLGAVIGPTLLYVRGGPAWVHDTYTDVALSGAPLIARPGELFVANDTRFGWTAGAGVEYMFLPQWSLRLEYDYYGLPDRSVGFDGDTGGSFTELIKQNMQTMTAGVNYHFGVPAVVATPVYPTKAPISNDGDTSNILGFTGVDVSKQSVYSWIGALIAPWQDLDTSGARVWIYAEGGGYKYNAEGTAFHGIYETGDALAGYGFEGDNYSINLLAGFNAINEMVTPHDPENAVQGTEAGLKVRADAYTTPTTSIMTYGEAEYSTAFQTWYVNQKVGFDTTNGRQIYIGPQVSAFGDERFTQWRVGAHISNIKFKTLEIDLSAGYADDSVVGTGAYSTLELSDNF
jgi:outer membrane immunogenic protein